jgi:hypothetical protein
MHIACMFKACNRCKKTQNRIPARAVLPLHYNLPKLHGCEGLLLLSGVELLLPERLGTILADQ